MGPSGVFSPAVVLRAERWVDCGPKPGQVTASLEIQGTWRGGLGTVGVSCLTSSGTRDIMVGVLGSEDGRRGGITSDWGGRGLEGTPRPTGKRELGGPLRWGLTLIVGDGVSQEGILMTHQGRHPN